jgi:hypothetical protein
MLPTMPPNHRTSTHLTIGETSNSLTTEHDSDSLDPFQNFYDLLAELVAKRHAKTLQSKLEKGLTKMLYQSIGDGERRTSLVTEFAMWTLTHATNRSLLPLAHVTSKIILL